MRLEFGFELKEVSVPRFSVEAVEGIGKLFTLATLVLNVLETKPRVEIVFHGLNPEDPEHEIAAFKEIVSSSETGAGRCAITRRTGGCSARRERARQAGQRVRARQGRGGWRRAARRQRSRRASARALLGQARLRRHR